jgi:hypothetical protein
MASEAQGLKVLRGIRIVLVMIPDPPGSSTSIAFLGLGDEPVLDGLSCFVEALQAFFARPAFIFLHASPISRLPGWRL